MYHVYPQMNQPQNAIDCCVELNQVNRSACLFVSLSHTHSLHSFITPSLSPFSLHFAYLCASGTRQLSWLRSTM